MQEREVRLAAQRILANRLFPRATDRFWDGLDLDLSGANLIDFDIRACQVGTARFDGALMAVVGVMTVERLAPDEVGDAWFGAGADEPVDDIRSLIHEYPNPPE